MHNLTIAVDRLDNKVHVPQYPSEILSSLSKTLQRYHLWGLIPFRHTPLSGMLPQDLSKVLVYLIVHTSPKHTWFYRKSPDRLNPEYSLYPNWNLIYLMFAGGYASISRKLYQYRNCKYHFYLLTKTKR